MTNRVHVRELEQDQTVRRLEKPKSYTHLHYTLLILTKFVIVKQSMSFIIFHQILEDIINKVL